MYLSRKLTTHSLPEIGAAFGGKDHTTVLHAYKKVEKDLMTLPDVKKSVDHLTAILLEWKSGDKSLSLSQVYPQVLIVVNDWKY